MSNDTILWETAPYVRNTNKQEIKVGNVVKGFVDYIGDACIFINFGRHTVQTGVLHIHDSSFYKEDNFSNIFEQYQDVEAVILHIDKKDDGYIKLGIKHLDPDYEQKKQQFINNFYADFINNVEYAVIVQAFEFDYETQLQQEVTEKNNEEDVGYINRFLVIKHLFIHINTIIITKYLYDNNYILPLLRKRQQLTYTDDYGDDCLDDFEKEVNRFVSKRYENIKLFIKKSIPNYYYTCRNNFVGSALWFIFEEDNEEDDYIKESITDSIIYQILPFFEHLQDE